LFRFSPSSPPCSFMLFFRQFPFNSHLRPDEKVYDPKRKRDLFQCPFLPSDARRDGLPASMTPPFAFLVHRSCSVTLHTPPSPISISPPLHYTISHYTRLTLHAPLPSVIGDSLTAPPPPLFQLLLLIGPYHNESKCVSLKRTPRIGRLHSLSLPLFLPLLFLKVSKRLGTRKWFALWRCPFYFIRRPLPSL